VKIFIVLFLCIATSFKCFSADSLEAKGRAEDEALMNKFLEAHSKAGAAPIVPGEMQAYLEKNRKIPMNVDTKYKKENAKIICNSKIMDNAFINSIKKSPLGSDYDFNGVATFVFESIQKDITKTIKTQCSKDALFSELSSQAAQVCKKSCLEQVAKFSDGMFTQKNKSVANFDQDCKSSCYMMDEKFKAYQLAVNDSAKEESKKINLDTACDNADAFSNLGRALKKVEEEATAKDKVKPNKDVGR
jgi:hypothetical protein